MISSRTVLSPSSVVPWAGERGERRQSAEALGQSLPERGKRLGIERPPFVVVQAKKYLEQVHWRHFLQNRSIPNMKSSATVMRAEISREPKEPRRFEKKKNMPGPEDRLHANQPNPASLPERGSRSRPRQSSRSVPISWSSAWCSGPLPSVRRNCPISVSEVRPPELRFGSCSTIGTPDCGSRTSRQMSPLALS